MTFLEICLVILAIVCMRLFNWKLKIGAFALYMIFSLLWYKAIRGLINGNAVIVIALLIACSLWAIKAEKDWLAGILLAIMTIKPHVVLLYFIFGLFWALSKRRWRLIGWSLGSVALMVLIGMIFIPDWLMQNLDEILRYPGYNPAGTAGAALQEMLPMTGSYLSLGLTVAVTLLLIYEWYLSWQKEFPGFLWGACITLVLSQLIGIQTDPGNFIILFVPLVYIFAGWQKRWDSLGEWGAISLMIALFFGLWGIFLATVQGNQQHPIMYLPLPIILLAGLYSVRKIRYSFI